jgi:hypothetical protein
MRRKLNFGVTLNFGVVVKGYILNFNLRWKNRIYVVDKVVPIKCFGNLNTKYLSAKVRKR